MRISELEKAVREVAQKGNGEFDLTALDSTRLSPEIRAAARSFEKRVIRRRGKNVMSMGEREDWV